MSDLLFDDTDMYNLWLSLWFGSVWEFSYLWLINGTSIYDLKWTKINNSINVLQMSDNIVN